MTKIKGKSAQEIADCIRALKAAGYPQTAAIGRIRSASDALEPVVLTA